MKKYLCLISAAAVLLFPCCISPGSGEESAKPPGINILMLMNDNFGLNYMLMLNTMELKGWKLTHLGTSHAVKPCLGFASAEQPPFIPDFSLTDFDNGQTFDTSAYDAMVLPPGTGSYAPIKDPFGDITGNPEALNFIRTNLESGMPLFAMCMGVIVPLEAGLLAGRKVVTTNKLKHRIMMADGKHLGADHPPVISDNLVTGVRGQYYNEQNMSALARAIEAGTRRRGRIKFTPAEWELEQAEVSEGNCHWIKYSGGSECPDGIRDGLQTADGGFFTCGYSFGRSGDTADGLLIKLGQDFSIQWSGYLGGPGYEYLNSAAQYNGVLYTAGWTTSGEDGSRNILLAALSAEGELLWTVNKGGPGTDMAIDLIISDQGPVIFGHTTEATEGEEDLLLMQFDFSGEPIREKRFGGRRSDTAAAITKSDKGFYLAASSGSFSKNSDFLLIETDSSGGVLSENVFDGGETAVEGFDLSTDIFISPDGRPALVGYSDARSPMGPRLIIPQDGDKPCINTGYKNGDFYNFGTAGISYKDEMWLLGTRRDRDFDSKIFLINTDSSGVPIRQYCLDSPERDWAGVLIQTESGLVVFGQCGRGGNSGDFDILAGRLSLPGV